jgi:hypothetical protein
MEIVGLCAPIMHVRDFPLLTFVMPQDLTFQQGASQLKTSINFWTFSTNTASPLRIQCPLLNPTELLHYHVTCIILLPRIIF